MIKESYDSLKEELGENTTSETQAIISISNTIEYLQLLLIMANKSLSFISKKNDFSFLKGEIKKLLTPILEHMVLIFLRKFSIKID